MQVSSQFSWILDNHTNSTVLLQGENLHGFKNQQNNRTLGTATTYAEYKGNQPRSDRYPTRKYELHQQLTIIYE
jgi:hypothetical protein